MARYVFFFFSPPSIHVTHNWEGMLESGERAKKRISEISTTSFLSLVWTFILSFSAFLKCCPRKWTHASDCDMLPSRNSGALEQACCSSLVLGILEPFVNVPSRLSTLFFSLFFTSPKLKLFPHISRLHNDRNHLGCSMLVQTFVLMSFCFGKRDKKANSSQKDLNSIQRKCGENKFSTKLFSPRTNDKKIFDTI